MSLLYDAAQGRGRERRMEGEKRCFQSSFVPSVFLQLCVAVRWPKVALKRASMGPCFCPSNLSCALVVGLDKNLRKTACGCTMQWSPKGISGNKHCNCLP